MNNSNFNPNEEIEAMKTTDAAETPVDDTPATDKAVAAETATEATASEPDVKQETVEETASEPADKADDAFEYGAGSSDKGRGIDLAGACCECLSCTGRCHDACNSAEHRCLLCTTGELREPLVLRCRGSGCCLHSGSIDRRNIQFVHR